LQINTRKSDKCFKSSYILKKMWVSLFELQKRILTKTTRNPKTDCRKRLKYIAAHFIKERWTKEKFTTEIKNILQEFKEFLNEKNDNNQYVHRSLRSALFGIKLALPYLFTYQDFPKLQIPIRQIT